MPQRVMFVTAFSMFTALILAPVSTDAAYLSLGVRDSLSCPADKESVAKSACEQANTALLPPGISQPAKFLVSGDWRHVPPGCSTQHGRDHRAHYNTNPQGKNYGSFTPICKRGPSPAPVYVRLSGAAYCHHVASIPNLRAAQIIETIVYYA